MNPLSVCILSALPMGADMQYLSGTSTSCLIRVGNKSILVHQLEALQRYFGAVLNIVVVCPEGSGGDVRSELIRWNNPAFRRVFVKEVNTITIENPTGYTFQDSYYFATKKLKDLSQDSPEILSSPAVFLPGDSILTNFDSIESKQPADRYTALRCRNSVVLLPIDSEHQLSDIPFADQMATSGRWTLLKSNIRGAEVYDRKVVPLQSRDPLYAFTGGATFRSLKEVETFLASIPNGRHSTDSDFFSVLLSSSERTPTLITSGYYDFGHPDTYQLSKSFNFSAREFNTLHTDISKGTVSKRSSSSTFKAQTNWLEFAQNRPETQFYVPRSFSQTSALKPKETTLTMELIPFPSLADLLHFHLPTYYWRVIARKCALLLGNLYSIRPEDPFDPESEEDSLDSMYFSKTLERFSVFKLENEDLLFKLQDKTYSLHDMEQLLVAFLKSNSHAPGLLRRPSYPLSLLHGDLCFSNVLFDRQSTCIKMIDPRGEFGCTGFYGDLAYDVAKLRHSFYGGYDLILSRHWLAQETACDQGTVISWATKVNPIIEASEAFRVAFSEAVSNKLLPAEMFTRARHIEPLLFLSMLPLHSDDKLRQRSLCLRGLELLLEVIEDRKSVV